ncbi:MAG: hypothetical protein A3H17_02410 [Candidatus Levybacteria bacterium RIFCSPLOWO2_12_FULL_37_14]|nr:MAG: hypothetical protein US59_C0025G0008 [Candidatus Levybacteria bacterium GW2011_GWB1_37_8]OGH49887.1 MAG: hypothetical protein A3H17_02410 [Candidatus Levybacteria bacterium RIFCSPLOWO2_12_FULL_37_14]
MIEKKVSGYSFRERAKAIVGLAICAAAVGGIILGANYVRHQGNLNLANVLKLEQDIFEKEGLRSAPLIDDGKGYFSYDKKTKIVNFKVKVLGSDNSTQSVTVSVPKENLIVDTATNPKTEPTVLFKLENFIENRGKFIANYIILNGNNSQTLNPVGPVTISLTQDAYKKLKELMK